MKGFFKYVENSTKRRFYRFLLFFILFIIITFCKSCKVYALTTINGTGTMLYNTSNCTELSDYLYCSKGQTYSNNFNLNQGSAQNTSVSINTKSNGVMVDSIIYEFDFSSTITLNGRYIRWNYPNITSSGTGSNTYLIFTPFAGQTYNTGNFNNSSAFIPFFAEYYSTVTNEWLGCDVSMYSNLPNGTNAVNFYFSNFVNNDSANKLRVYIGQIGTYYGPYKVLNNYKVPDNENYIYRDNCNSNYNCFYVKYSNIGNLGSTRNAGLFYYAQGSTRSGGSVGFGANSSGLQYDNATIPNNLVNYSYKGKTLEEVTNNTTSIDNIEEQITVAQQSYGTQPNDDNSDFSSIQNNYDAFSQSQYASKFTGLVSSIFAYPLVKLNQMAEIDLVATNLNGTKILNNQLCYNLTGGDNPLQDAQPYKLHLFRDYTVNLPCPHTDMYNQLYYGNYGFYSSNFKGASTTSTASISFASIWLTIQHGLLVYLLFINVLNIYKYIIDSNKVDIEVLEL